MIELEGRKIDEYGNVIFDQNGLIDLLFNDYDISDLLVHENEEFKQYNSFCKMYDHSDQQLSFYNIPSYSVDEFDKLNQQKWFIPEVYKSIDIEEFLYDKCTTEEEIIRVQYELEYFKKYNLLPVLLLLIYLVDHFRKNKIIWGVGRGSSVSSYVLFLIGIHKINSIAYDLDFNEFLK